MNSIKANHSSSTLSRTKVSFQQRLTPRHVSKAVETSEPSVLTSDFVSTPVIDDIPPIFIEPSSALSTRTVDLSSPPETTYSLKAPFISSYPSGKSLPLKAETESDGFPGLDSFSDVGSQAAEAISKASEKASSAAGELVGSVNSLLSSLGKQVKDMATEEAGVKVEDVSGSATSLITTNLMEEVVGSSSEHAEAAASELNSSITSLISGFGDQLGDVTEEAESAAYEVSGSVTSLISGLVDQLGDVTGDFGSAADELTGNVTSFISGLSDQLEVVTGSTGASVVELASDVSSMLSGIEDQAMSNVSSELLSSSFEEASGALMGTVSESASALTGTVSESASSLKEASETLTSTLTEATSSAAEAMSEVTDSLTLSMSAATQDVLEKVEEQAAAVQDLLQEVVAEFGDIREGAASTVAETVEELQLVTESAVDTANGSLQQILGVLPPDVRETVLAVVAVVTAAVSSVSDTATHYPRESAVAAAVVAVPVIMGVIKAGKPEGYSGDIEPALVRALLQEDIEALAELDPSLYRRLQKNAGGKNLDYVLIDIREDEEREEKGRPELKLGARFKVAALPLSTADTLISPDLARRGRNMEVLKLDIAAAIIAGLKEVKSQLANVVIMDNTGSSKAREVARALRREGVFQAYVMKGGYQQWVSQDLPTSEGATYETNASLLIKDEVEFLTEKAQATWEEVKKPEVGLPILGSTVVGSIALINYHTTLQVIGLWVLAYSVYNGTAFSFASSSVSTIAKLVGGGGSSKSTEPNSKEQAFSLSTAGLGASGELNVAQSPSSPTTMQSSSQEQQFDDSEDMEDGPSDTPDEASEVVNTSESIHKQEQPDKLKGECSAQVLVESGAKSSMPSEKGQEATSELNNQAASVHGKEHAADEESSLGQDAARVVTENSASWISDTSQTATPSRALS